MLETGRYWKVSVSQQDLLLIKLKVFQSVINRKWRAEVSSHGVTTCNGEIIRSWLPFHPHPSFITSSCCIILYPVMCCLLFIGRRRLANSWEVGFLFLLCVVASGQNVISVIVARVTKSVLLLLFLLVDLLLVLVISLKSGKLEPFLVCSVVNFPSSL